MEKVKERLPEMEVEVLPAIGENARLQRLLRDMAREEALRLELEARAPAGSTV